jgi:hypothetical protein
VNGGSSAREGHRCAQRQRGAGGRRTEGGVGVTVAQRMGGRRVKVTGVLACGGQRIEAATDEAE